MIFKARCDSFISFYSFLGHLSISCGNDDDMIEVPLKERWWKFFKYISKGYEANGDGNIKIIIIKKDNKKVMMEVGSDFNHPWFDSCLWFYLL